jgi:hypothetical protein
MDGVQLGNMTAGAVREVSPSIGAWLIAEGFAVLEMRQQREQIPLGSASGVANERRKQKTD